MQVSIIAWSDNNIIRDTRNRHDSHCNFYCPNKEAAMVIVVVSLSCTAYPCGSFIVLWVKIQTHFRISSQNEIHFTLDYSNFEKQFLTSFRSSQNAKFIVLLEQHLILKCKEIISTATFKITSPFLHPLHLKSIMLLA